MINIEYIQTYPGEPPLRKEGLFKNRAALAEWLERNPAVTVVKEEKVTKKSWRA